MILQPRSRTPVQDLTLTASTAPGEAGAWSDVGAGWRPLFGRYADLGFSFEWHDFEIDQSLDWSRSFHPGSIELCLNLEGVGEFQTPDGPRVLGPRNLAFYHPGPEPLSATRRAGIRHRFITVEFAPAFLRQQIGSNPSHLHPMIGTVIGGRSPECSLSPVQPMPAALFPLVESLRHCPVFEPARATWFQCKAVEVATLLFYQPASGELFCTRAQRAARERVEKARAILAERLAQPPSLEDLARMVGCSSFYLSRQFSQETGMTLQQHLRHLRLEKAAELLRSGHCNVTEAALEVGYNSLSHFSTAFHEMFGCCPGLYPRIQRPASRP